MNGKKKNAPAIAKLYVNLSASQTRKRLKRFGHGVRKVQSEGRNQAVILHTATGQHLEELEALLADANPSRTLDQLGAPLENLRNLGPTSAAWLREAGLLSQKDLQQVGPVVAFQMVRKQQPGASFNLLWALAGALSEQDCRSLSDADKQALRTEYEELQF